MTEMQLICLQLWLTFLLNCILGCLVGWVGWTSHSWFWLRSSQGCEIKPHLCPCAECGVCSGFSLLPPSSLPLCAHMHSCSLSKMNKLSSHSLPWRTSLLDSRVQGVDRGYSKTPYPIVSLCLWSESWDDRIPNVVEFALSQAASLR